MWSLAFRGTLLTRNLILFQGKGSKRVGALYVTCQLFKIYFKVFVVDDDVFLGYEEREARARVVVVVVVVVGFNRGRRSERRGRRRKRKTKMRKAVGGDRRKS